MHIDQGFNDLSKVADMDACGVQYAHRSGTGGMSIMRTSYRLRSQPQFITSVKCLSLQKISTLAILNNLN